MLSRRCRAFAAFRALIGFGSLALALAAPQVLVLCTAEDGHVTVERAHAGDLCFAEAVRHAAAVEGDGERVSAPCDDTVVDVQLARTSAPNERLAPPVSAAALPGALAPLPFPRPVELSPTRGARSLRTVVLQL